MNRRTFLLGMLAAMTLPLPALSEQKDLTLVLATDLHYISPELTDNGPYFTRMFENADGKVMTKIEPLTEAFVEEMIAMKPDALILSGDLTFNGAKQSHEDLVKSSCASAKQVSPSMPCRATTTSTCASPPGLRATATSWSAASPLMNSPLSITTSVTAPPSPGIRIL